MKSFVRIFNILTFALLLILSVFARETVIYENDFQKYSLGDFSLNGGWVIRDGRLTTGSGSGSAYLHYTIPKEYEGLDYKVEVDFIGHTSTGGIMIGATSPTIKSAPAFSHGFDCFISKAGDKAALGCYKSDGSWKGNIAVGDSYIENGADLHLSVTVVGERLTYKVFSLDKKTQYYGIEYTIGQGSIDEYTEFASAVGLRKFYGDNGGFDNFRVSVFTKDALPVFSEKIELGGKVFNSAGLSKSGDVISGDGAMLTEPSLPGDFKATFSLSPKGNSKVLFGMTDSENGYAFSVDRSNETLFLHKIENGEYIWLAERRMPIGEGKYPVTVSANGGILTLLFDAYNAGEDAFPSFEMKLDGYVAGKFGLWLEGGSAEELVFSTSEGKVGETYQNPIFVGADPEIIYHDGTYYAYLINKGGGDNIVQVYVSPDLVNWMDGGIVYTQKSHYTGSAYMSPNVFYNERDGYFYLFLAGKNADETLRNIYYAYSNSPYGPFEHKGGQQTVLHKGLSEIGGAPFLDDDGKFYISFCRMNNGNQLYVEEFTIDNGIVTPVAGTLTKIMSPRFEYEIDGYGNVSEGGVFTKHNGLYYLMWASGHYKGHYGQAYAVSESIFGPYERYEYNDIITHNSLVDGVGDCIFIKSPDGKELWVAYHQHSSVGVVEPRETRIDRVQFVKNPSGGPDILTINAPSTTPQYMPSFEGRFDLDSDGKVTLKDVLELLVWQKSASGYNGRYDLDSSGRHNYMDAVELMKKLAE